MGNIQDFQNFVGRGPEPSSSHFRNRFSGRAVWMSRLVRVSPFTLVLWPGYFVWIVIALPRFYKLFKIMGWFGWSYLNGRTFLRRFEWSPLESGIGQLIEKLKSGLSQKGPSKKICWNGSKTDWFSKLLNRVWSSQTWKKRNCFYKGFGREYG